MLNPERVQAIIENKGVKIPEIAQDAHFWIISQDLKAEAEQKTSDEKRLEKIRKDAAKERLARQLPLNWSRAVRR